MTTKSMTMMYPTFHMGHTQTVNCSTLTSQRPSLISVLDLLHIMIDYNLAIANVEPNLSNSTLVSLFEDSQPH